MVRVSVDRLRCVTVHPLVSNVTFDLSPVVDPRLFLECKILHARREVVNTHESGAAFAFERTAEKTSSHGYVTMPFGRMKADVTSDKRRRQEMIALFIFVTVTTKFVDVLVRRVLVEMPDVGVVAVGDSESSDPGLLRSIASSSRHQSRDDRRRADVELKPLLVVVLLSAPSFVGDDVTVFGAT